MVHFGAIAAGASPRMATATLRHQPCRSWPHYEKTFRAFCPYEVGHEVQGGACGASWEVAMQDSRGEIA